MQSNHALADLQAIEGLDEGRDRAYPKDAECKNSSDREAEHGSYVDSHSSRGYCIKTL